MLRRDKAHVTSDDKPFLKLEDAKAHELLLLMSGEKAPHPLTQVSEGGSDILHREVSEWILLNSDAIANVLTTTKYSRPGGRKSNGATKKPPTKKTTNPGPLPAALQV